MPMEPRKSLAKLKNAAIPKESAISILSLATPINTFGNGLFMTVAVIYFTFFFIHSFISFILLSLALGAVGAPGQTLRMATIALCRTYGWQRRAF